MWQGHFSSRRATTNSMAPTKTTLKAARHGASARVRGGRVASGAARSRPGARESLARRQGVAVKVQSSPAGYEGDLSESLLLGLSDDELENLATEYEYDLRGERRGEALDYEDESGEAEVDVLYEGMTNEEAEAESKDFASTLAEALSEVKVQDIVLLHVGPYVSWCTYFVVASVFSRPQLDAALFRVAEAAQEKHGRTSLNTERPGRTEWECIDYGDVVVHIMTPRQREKYDLEGYYSKAKRVEYLANGEREERGRS